MFENVWLFQKCVRVNAFNTHTCQRKEGRCFSRLRIRIKKFSASAIFHSANVVLSLNYRPFHQQWSPDSSGGNDQL